MTEQEVNNLIDSKIGKVKMSQLPETDKTGGLYSIGYIGNQSVKYKSNLLQGDPLTVRKTYQTEVAALADKNPIDTTTSLPLKVGQFVSIVDDGEKNGIYRISSIGGDGTMSLELQGKLGDLSGYTKTGGSTKTTKDIEDDLVQLAGDVKDVALNNWLAEPIDPSHPAKKLLVEAIIDVRYWGCDYADNITINVVYKNDPSNFNRVIIYKNGVAAINDDLASLTTEGIQLLNISNSSGFSVQILIDYDKLPDGFSLNVLDGILLSKKCYTNNDLIEEELSKIDNKVLEFPIINTISSEAKLDTFYYESEEVASTFIGGYMDVDLSIHILEREYGHQVHPVEAGKTYLIYGNSTGLDIYAGLSFSLVYPESGAKAEYLLFPAGRGLFSTAYTPASDGYLIFGKFQGSSATVAEITSIGDSVKEKLEEKLSRPELADTSTQSPNFCDYWEIQALLGAATYANNVPSSLIGIFSGNTTKLNPEVDTDVYIVGAFHSETDWLNLLKTYQTEDGTPLEIILKARVYNKGSKQISIIVGTRRREGGGWITPYNTEVEISPSSYEDIEWSYTYDYNALTTTIDLYTIFKNSAGCEIEIGNTDLYWIDPKKRAGTRSFINPKNISKGIEFEQLSENLQNKVGGTAMIIPHPKSNLVLSGSSITWGDGSLDGAFVGKIDDYIKEVATNTVLADKMAFSPSSTAFNNNILYKSLGREISGLNSKVVFTLFGNEIAICQAKKRTTDFGIMTVKADGVVIGKFDNKNEIGHETEIFTGSDINSVRLKHPATYNHQIIINGSTILTNIVINTTSGVISTEEAFIVRGLDSEGKPVHIINFNESLGVITSVEVSYDYGRIIGHERSTRGQLDDGLTNESYSGVGSISFDPANPTGGASSGMEFRAIDERAFFIHKFTEAKERVFEIEITGGENPYFVINYATNRFHNLMNAGIGGWKLSLLLDNNKINDYTQFYKWFQPDTLFQESSTNDDWENSIRRISRNIGKITKAELVALPGLEVTKVVYDSGTDTYDVDMATGIITSITPYSLISSDIIGTETIVGDIVRIGTYYGDNKQVVCRKISEVNLTTGEIKWLEPINADNILNIETLSDLVGAEINIRNLDTYKAKYKDLIERVRAISPQTKIVIVSSGLSMYWIRQLWGYEIVHRELCSEYHNVHYCDVADWLYDAQMNSIDGTSKEVVTSTGDSSYALSFYGTRNSWQGFKVLVNGIDVYGKDCYIKSGWFYHSDPAKSGADLDKDGVYPREVDAPYSPMRLIFTKNIPSVSDTIEVQFANQIWSGDYCHTNDYGAFLYAQALSKHIQHI